MPKDEELLAFVKANPWALVNIAQPGWECGRYPSRHLAIRAADTWPRIVSIGEIVRTVWVSDVPLANPKPEIVD